MLYKSGSLYWNDVRFQYAISKFEKIFSNLDAYLLGINLGFDKKLHMAQTCIL